jgi:ubiquinone/menaquinone biosynthesis C-methylase UbiE
MKKNETSWGEVAEWYDAAISDEDSFQQQVILPNILRLMNLRKEDEVLDLACGTGFFTGTFADYSRVVGVDIGKELIEIAKKNNPKVPFKVASAEDLSVFSPAQFNKISLILAIQNIEDVKKMLWEAKRILQPSGKMYIVMNHPSFRIPKRSSWGWDDAEAVQYRRIDGYLHESKETITMHPGTKNSQETVSFHRPMQYYFKLFTAAGFNVGRLEEWISHKKSQAGPRQKEEDRIRSEIPMFLFLELIKV